MVRASINQLAAEAVAGKTLDEIADRHGMSRVGVWRRLARLGATLPRRRAIRLTERQIEALEEGLEEPTLLDVEIARLARVSKQTVGRWRRLLRGEPDERTPVEPYRCGSCGNRVERRPCPICVARGAIVPEPVERAKRIPPMPKPTDPRRPVQLFLFD